MPPCHGAKLRRKGGGRSAARPTLGRRTREVSGTVAQTPCCARSKKPAIAAAAAQLHQQKSNRQIQLQKHDTDATLQRSNARAPAAGLRGRQRQRGVRRRLGLGRRGVPQPAALPVPGQTWVAPLGLSCSSPGRGAAGPVCRDPCMPCMPACCAAPQAIQSKPCLPAGRSEATDTAPAAALRSVGPGRGRRQLHQQQHKLHLHLLAGPHVGSSSGGDLQQQGAAWHQRGCCLVAAPCAAAPVARPCWPGL
jgi:hypothetical protein